MKKRKGKKLEKLEEDLENFDFEKLSEVKEVVFDNYINFFIIKNYNNDFDLLKIKKFGKDYIDLKNILTYKIGILILFDRPLIIGDKFPKNDEPHLENIGQRGFIENITLKINSLDCYGKKCNLNFYKTLKLFRN